jgi:hypothetical protein
MKVISLAAVLFLLAVSASWGSAGGVSGSATLHGGGHGSVTSMSCAAPGECAAGGYYSTAAGDHAFVVNETKGRWGKAIEVPGTETRNGGVDAKVSSISCAAVGDCAAGGYYSGSTGDRAFVVTERKGRWGKAIEVPGTAALNSGDYAKVSSVSCAAAGGCAAGGLYYDVAFHPQAFVVSETKGRWGKAIEVPGTAALNSGGDAQVNSVSCGAVGECAAGGYYAGSTSRQAFVVTETNGSWGTAIEVPGMSAFNTYGNANLLTLSCTAAGECAAGGDYAAGYYAFVVSETNGSWGNALTVPGGIETVTSISCSAPGECAAGGYDGYFSGPRNAFVVSETSGSWGTAIEVPGTDTLNAGWSGGVDSISCAAAGECAAGGFYSDGSYLYPVHEHPFVAGETNGSWGTAIEVPGTAAVSGSPAHVNSISCAATGDCAAGGFVTDGMFGERPFVVSEKNGSWGEASAVRLPVLCVVPNVVGKAIKAAKKRIDAADCGFGKITHVYSKLSEGRVVAQRTTPGTHLSAGTSVGLIVSRGPKPSPLSRVKTRWRAIVAPLPANAARGLKRSVYLVSISCASPGNCSAVGVYNDKAGVQQGLLLTETAGQWVRGVEAVLPADALAQAQVNLTSISCASAGNCTAVGSYNTGPPDIYSDNVTHGLLLTEKAGHWTAGVEAVLPPSASAYPVTLNSVSCASAGNCTAVGSYGYYDSTSNGLLLTETSGHWKRGASYGNAGAGLTSVSCASDGTCSAVGYQDLNYGDRNSGPSADGLLLTKKRGRWRQAGMPPDLGPSEGLTLRWVSCAAGANCSAIGTYNISIDTSIAPSGLLLNEHAGKWADGVTAQAPKNARTSYWTDSVDLAGISCTSPGDCLAVGDYYITNSRYHLTMLTEQAGKWQRGVEAVLPRGAGYSAPSAVSCSSPGNCTVAGGYSGGGGHGFLLTEIAGRFARGVRAPHFTHSLDYLSSVSCAAPGTCGAVGEGWTSGGPNYGVLFDSTTNPCVVPELKGRTLPTARHSLEVHNCSVGTVARASSQTIKTGHVISQALAPERHLAPGTTVDLTVSRGP